MINLGTRRECFFDDYLIDIQKTTASAVIHKARAEEITQYFNAPWETGGIAFLHFFYDEDISKYRLYYDGREKKEITKENTHGEIIRICYAESEDGITWTKPKLALREFAGYKDNNIILDLTDAPYFDNFYVFKDNNPKCNPEEKYKAVSEYNHCLYSYISEDGINFKRHKLITDEGSFDSLNTAMWDEDAKIYRCYFRSFHVPGDFEGKDPFDRRPLEVDPEERNLRIRDIRYIESKDFENWSEQKKLRFNGKEESMYTNCIGKYYRAPHILLGFPSRYIQRPAWSGAYENLCSKEYRKEIMKRHNRYGLAITDCIFITSRDGVNFTKYDEAFMTPGAERDNSWYYGDCYPAVGFILTDSKYGEDSDKEISMFCAEGKFGCRNAIRRYTIRQDGFRSYHAGGEEKTLITKPFIFEGDSLYANIKTSAAGYIYFEISDMEGHTVRSCEMFGDSIDKRISFEGDLSLFSGKEVVMTLKMYDSDIYSIKFERR